MKAYIITFRNGEKTEQKADWFTLHSSLTTAVASFFIQLVGLPEGQLFAAFTDVHSVVQKAE